MEGEKKSGEGGSGKNENEIKSREMRIISGRGEQVLFCFFF